MAGCGWWMIRSIARLCSGVARRSLGFGLKGLDRLFWAVVALWCVEICWFCYELFMSPCFRGGVLLFCDLFRVLHLASRETPTPKPQNLSPKPLNPSPSPSLPYTLNPIPHTLNPILPFNPTLKLSSQVLPYFRKSESLISDAAPEAAVDKEAHGFGGPGEGHGLGFRV